jgi:hypothetical protein
VLGLCLDLNVFVADLLAEAAGRPSTAARRLVGVAAAGRCALGPVRLVISFGMLDRLEHVLEHKLGLGSRLARERRDLIAGFASLGPAGGPALTLGGLGTMPMLDVEDRHVLETARAGRADWLVTANLRDFIAPSRTGLAPRQVRQDLAVMPGLEGGRLLIVHPRPAGTWIEDLERYRADTVDL